LSFLAFSCFFVFSVNRYTTWGDIDGGVILVFVSSDHLSDPSLWSPWCRFTYPFGDQCCKLGLEFRLLEGTKDSYDFSLFLL
jgi:hypothetical protein